MTVVSPNQLTFPESFNALVTQIDDGDTFWVYVNGYSFKVRFANIDAPEKDQPWGIAARNFLASLILNKTVLIFPVEITLNRLDANVHYKELDVQAVMVSYGYAWDYTQYSHGLYLHTQNIAQQEGWGLWSSNNYISPYNWRRIEKHGYGSVNMNNLQIEP